MAKFEDLKITTMTQVYHLNKEVNLEVAFSVLPIHRIKLPVRKRDIKRIKIPPCKKMGVLLSIRYRNKIRGIVRSKSNKMFSHSVTIDLSMKDRGICAKLAPKSIHMTGVGSYEMGELGQRKLIDLLVTAQNLLTRIRTDPESSIKTVEWVVHNTMGNLLLLPGVRTVARHKKIRFVESCRRLEYRVKKPTEIPDDIDTELAEFLLRYCSEYRYHSDLRNFYQYLLSLKKVCSPRLAISSINTYMINFNYELGFCIDKRAIAELFDNNDGFYSVFNVAVHSNVTVNLPYHKQEVDGKIVYRTIDPCDIKSHRRYVKEAAGKAKKRLLNKLTWLIYNTGRVTYSGPSLCIMKESHERFISILRGNLDIIKLMTTDKKGRQVVVKTPPKRKSSVPSIVVFPGET